MSKELKVSLSLMDEKIEKTHSSHSSREQEIKRILEALLFASSEAISIQKLKEIIKTSYPVTSQELKKMISSLNAEYKERGHAFQIDEIADGYLLRTKEEMREFVEKLHQERRSEKLSKAATEVLAIIACKAPITRAEVEKIRGVDSFSALASLQERELIEAVSRKEAPGKPLQYGVTKKFLQHYGLKDLNDLLSILAT